MKNRTIIGILCIVVALAVCFGVAPMVNKLTAEKTDIIRLVKDVTQGYVITEEDITVVAVGSFNLPEGVIKDKAVVVGKYAACDLKKDDYILPSKLSATADSANDVFKLLDGTRQAMSVSIASFASGLSGKLQNGDIVSIVTTSNGESFIPDELKYVRVITTTTTYGDDADQANTSTDEKSQPSTITLLVNDLQATRLAGCEDNGKLHVVLVYRGTDDKSKAFIDAQNETLIIIAGQMEESSDTSTEMSEGESYDDIISEVNSNE